MSNATVWPRGGFLTIPTERSIKATDWLLYVTYYHRYIFVNENVAKFTRIFINKQFMLMNRIFTTFFAGLVMPVAVAFAAEVSVPQRVVSQLRDMAPAAVEAEGETIDLSRNCHSYVNVGGFVVSQSNYGSVAQLVKSADGTGCTLVYPVAELSTRPIAGTISDEKVTFVLPQVVNQVTIDDEGTPETYDIVIAAFTEKELEDGYTSWLAADNQTVAFDLASDGAMTAENSTVMLGVGMDMGDLGIQWIGFGDTNITMTPMTAEPVSLPAGVTPENYVVRSFDSPYIAHVGFDGDDVYVQGLVQGVPEGWIKGKLSDGKVTFANGQYLGVAHTISTFRNYAYCIVTTKDYDDDFNEVFGPVEPTFEVTYDPEAKSMTFPTNQIVGMSLDPEELYLRSVMEFVSLEYRGEFEPTTPPDPVIEYFGAYDPETGYGEIDFTMPDEGADGKVLDFSNYYYNLIVDGELYEITPAVYPSVTAPMTDIPYTFSDDNDFYSYSEGYHIFYFRVPEYRTIALQAVYTIDGVTNRSAVVLVNEAGVEDAVIDLAPVVNEEYFDLSGRAVSPRSAGILIRRVTRADGSVETFKTVAR